PVPAPRPAVTAPRQLVPLFPLAHLPAVASLPVLRPPQAPTRSPGGAPRRRPLVPGRQVAPDHRATAGLTTSTTMTRRRRRQSPLFRPAMDRARCRAAAGPGEE